jgi:hypothetical protein
MVSAPSCELKTCTPATRSAWAFGHFSAQTARRDSSAGCRGSAYGVTGMLENSLPMPPNCRRVANRKPSRSNALVALVRPSSSRHVSSWRLGCRAARRAPFAANRASTPRATRRSPPACWERSIGWPSASCVFKCCKVTAARHPAKPSSRARSMALSRSEPPRSLSISATRRSNALAALVRPFELAARKQLRLGCRASTSRA